MSPPSLKDPRCCCTRPIVYEDPKTGETKTYDWRPKTPWRAPGSAPVFGPCGFDGGNPHGCPPGNPAKFQICGAGGYAHGPDGRSLPGNTRPLAPSAQWKAGDVVEGWGIAANHGGGYLYRLCPQPADSMELTEECFQRTPLRFVGDTQWARFNINGSRIAFPAMRTTNGTVPAGSQWTRVPFPGCFNPKNPTSLGVDGVCTEGTQFPPPFPGAFGFVSTFYPQSFYILPKGVKRLPEVAIVDKVQVPADLKPGNYVVSFRYDCEQTSQVWNQCGDVTISA